MTTSTYPAAKRGGAESERVREVRRRARLSQQAVATELAISRISYLQWENGQGNLPWALTWRDALEAIERLKAAKTTQD